MAKYEPLTVREWLEAMLVFRGRDADRAWEILDLLDEADVATLELSKYDEWFEDFETAKKMAVEREALAALVEQDAIASEMPGDTVDEQLRATLKYVAECEAKMFALRELCAEAGLLAASDQTTDPLPLLRMFLPS